jgi:hypothetical protein
MDFFPSVVLDEIRNLNYNLKELNGAMVRSSKSSDELQTKLIFWTKIMAGAIIVQAIAIGVQIYLTLQK